jgi:hypothetical protein
MHGVRLKQVTRLAGMRHAQLRTRPRSATHRVAAVLAALAAFGTPHPSLAQQQLEGAVWPGRVPEPGALLQQFPADMPRQRATPMIVERVRRMWDPAAVERAQLPQPLLECIARLDDPRFDVRQRASAELDAGAFPLEELIAALARGRLSPEQHVRLVAAACTRALALPRGALGIRMQSSMDRIRPGVEISMLLPGMPAERVLRAGDRIERIGDIAVDASDQLVATIQSRVPGDVVRLTVARARRDDRGRIQVGEDGASIEDRIEVEVELADAAELERFEARLPSVSSADWREAVVREIRTRFPEREISIPVGEAPPPASRPALPAR